MSAMIPDLGMGAGVLVLIILAALWIPATWISYLMRNIFISIGYLILVLLVFLVFYFWPISDGTVADTNYDKFWVARLVFLIILCLTIIAAIVPHFFAFIHLKRSIKL